MKKYLFTVLVISLLQFSCSAPPEQGQTPSQEQDPSQQAQQDKEPVDVFTPEERARIEKRKACQANPEGEGCACVLNSSSLDCKCSKDEYANSSECRCHKNPNDAGCACTLNPESVDCFCSKNPNAEKCRLSVEVDVLCRRYCFSPEANREDSLTKKLLEADCDHDDLPNKFEIKNGLDPCNADTNGNGIVDSNDTYDGGDNAGDLDEDGVPDEVEERLQLEKENPFTDFEGVFGYKDRIESHEAGHRYGATDKDLWIIDACEKRLKEVESLELPEKTSHSVADIKITLPTDSKGTFFAPDNLQTRDAAMLFSSGGQGIYGGLLAKEVSSRKLPSPKEYLDVIISRLAPENFVAGANLKTHDNFDFVQADIIVGSNARTNLQKVLFDIFSRSLKEEGSVPLSKFNGLEEALSNGEFIPASETNRNYSLKLSVIYRKHRNKQGEDLPPGNEAADKDQLILLYAFAPVEKRSSSLSSAAQYAVASDLIATRLRDLTNTTSITQIKNEKKPICVELRTQAKRKPVYFYFVLDESGSMDGYNQALVDITNTFFDKVKNTALDFKVGVTNIAELSFGDDKRGGGQATSSSSPPVIYYKGVAGVSPPQEQSQLGVVARWIGKDSESKFQADVNVIKTAGGQTEVGFTRAENGIRTMRNLNDTSERKLPANAEVIIIWVSDEEDHTYSNTTNQRSQSFLEKQINIFKNELNATAFAIVANPEQMNNESSGYSYRYVAQGTGGGYGKLSTDPSNYLSTLDSIIDKANSVTSHDILPQTPISSSLQLYKDASYGGNRNDPANLSLHRKDSFVPRSLENGFSYSAGRNVISFTGRYKPFVPKNSGRGEDFIVLYYFYDYKTKQF